MAVLVKFAIPLLCISSIAVLPISAILASTGTDNVLTSLQADDLKVVQNGERIYQSQCAACHGAFLEGQPEWRTRNSEGLLPAPPHDASGHTWHHADDLLFEITKYGAAVVIGDPTYRSIMPAYEGILTDEEIIAVLSFIKNTWPEEQRQWQEEINASQTEGLLPPSKGSGILDKLFK